MNHNIENIFEKQSKNAIFIKVTDSPVPLTPEQKVVLNRKGNEFFNNGDVLSARRLFITTGYSDGLTRVGDKLYNDKKELDALKLYYLAHNKRKSEPIIQKLAQMISLLIEEKDI